jgi:hypothetical protein
VHPGRSSEADDDRHKQIGDDKPQQHLLRSQTAPQAATREVYRAKPVLITAKPGVLRDPGPADQVLFKHS